MRYFLLYLFLVSTANANEDEYNFKMGNFGARLREDTWHVEAEKKFFNTMVTYRYADLKKEREHRIKFTNTLYKHGNFSLQGRTEYRSNKDHWRTRLIVNYKRPISKNLSVWVKLQPRYTTDNVYDSRHQLGIQYKAVSTFIEKGVFGVNFSPRFSLFP